MKNIIGRDKEQTLLNRYINSNRAEFVAIYGRRRVGKTYLVSRTFAGRFAFSMTGVLDGTRGDQLTAFADAMEMYGNTLPAPPNNWMKAFGLLRKFLQTKIENGEPCIVFLDEIPCLDTHNSGFVKALGYFWNSWASLQENFKLIVCGSATAWMIKNIIDSKGGLHNRITHEMRIKPFTLLESEQYLKSEGFIWSRLSILQAYMVFGGVAYYLSLLQPEESLSQNIDRLLFSPDGELRREYNRLYKTLFNTPEPYIKIVNLLGESPKGLTRSEIAKSIGTDAGGTLSEQLANLCECGIIRKFKIREKSTVKGNGGLYQLIDFFSLFYQHFVMNNDEKNWWSKHINTPEINTWLGLAFERICLTHTEQILLAMHLDSISTTQYAWRSSTSKPAAQIDLIIDRADNMINLCEIKYSKDEYYINAEEDQKLRHRLTTFQNETATRSGIFVTMITTFGLANGMYNSTVNIKLTMDDLFL